MNTLSRVLGNSAAMPPPNDDDLAQRWAAAGLPLPADGLHVTNSADAGAIEHFVALWWRNARTATVHGQTPLHLAAMSGLMPAVRTLLAAGADLHALDEDGDTPLHHAADAPSEAAAIALIEAGADINAENFEGWTPLHHATASGKTQIARALMERGADTQRPDNVELTLLSLASESLRRGPEAPPDRIAPLDLAPGASPHSVPHDTAIATVVRWASLARSASLPSGEGSGGSASNPLKAKSPRESESDSDSDSLNTRATRQRR